MHATVRGRERVSLYGWWYASELGAVRVETSFAECVHASVHGTMHEGRVHERVHAWMMAVAIRMFVDRNWCVPG